MVHGREASYTAITLKPRVKLYSPREESFPVPLKYIDVTRTTHTNLDVKQEKRIYDYWNIDGSRDLSDPWTGFTQFTLLDEKAPDRIYLVRGEINEETAYIQCRSTALYSSSPRNRSTSSSVCRAGALVPPSSCLDGGPHGWVPVDTHSTPVLTSVRRLVAYVVHEPNQPQEDAQPVHGSGARVQDHDRTSQLSSGEPLAQVMVAAEQTPRQSESTLLLHSRDAGECHVGHTLR